MEKDDGGQAFPVAGLSQLPNDQFMHPCGGMTLRDYFAAAALQGVIAREGVLYENSAEDVSRENVLDDIDEMARAAYLAADAMLEARKH